MGVERFVATHERDVLHHCFDGALSRDAVQVPSNVLTGAGDKFLGCLKMSTCCSGQIRGESHDGHA